MQSVPTTIPPRRTTSRKLTLIVEGQYGRHQRIELLISPGMTVADLHFDEFHTRLVQPGGGVVAATDDLFEIAADTPKLFALCDAPRRVRQRAPSAQRRFSLARLPRFGARVLAAITSRPNPGHGVAR